MADMTWEKLTEFELDYIAYGGVFRCIGKYPYEETVDFMMFDPMDDEKSLGLIVVTGKKAGLIKVILPFEARYESESRYSVSKKWLIENWGYWVYGDCSVEDVLFCSAYSAV